MFKCVPGCRGTGGNGCPDGETCSSPNATPGTCTRIPDGGVPDAAHDAAIAADGPVTIADGAPIPDGTAPDMVPSTAPTGCGCDVGRRERSAAHALLLSLGIILLALRRRGL
jgi:hypothetical protein